jgi:hypothetical protein
MAKQPQVGDRYIPLFQSDLEECTRDVQPMTISEVKQLFDDEETWEIIASDGHGYDCVWSDRHQIWCYNLG